MLRQRPASGRRDSRFRAAPGCGKGGGSRGSQPRASAGAVAVRLRARRGEVEADPFPRLLAAQLHRVLLGDREIERVGAVGDQLGERDRLGASDRNLIGDLGPTEPGLRVEVLVLDRVESLRRTEVSIICSIHSAARSRLWAVLMSTRYSPRQFGSSPSSLRTRSEGQLERSSGRSTERESSSTSSG